MSSHHFSHLIFFLFVLNLNEDKTEIICFIDWDQLLSHLTLFLGNADVLILTAHYISQHTVS